MHAASSLGVGSNFHGWPVIGAGLRAEFESIIMRQALGSAGLLSPDLAAGLDALGEAGHSVTEAGLAAKRHDLIGTLIDEMA